MIVDEGNFGIAGSVIEVYALITLSIVSDATGLYANGVYVDVVQVGYLDVILNA